VLRLELVLTIKGGFSLLRCAAVLWHLLQLLTVLTFFYKNRD